jgi:hypothetical protein
MSAATPSSLSDFAPLTLSFVKADEDGRRETISVGQFALTRASIEVVSFLSTILRMEQFNVYLSLRTDDHRDLLVFLGCFHLQEVATEWAKAVAPGIFALARVGVPPGGTAHLVNRDGYRPVATITLDRGL